MKYPLLIVVLFATSTTAVAQANTFTDLNPQQGQNLSVAITGQNTLFTQSSPTLTSITPNHGSQGQSLTVTITGQNTHFLQGSGTVASQNSASAMRGQSLPVTITGHTHFGQGSPTTGVWFSQGSLTITPTIIASSYSALSNTSLTADFYIPTDANTGLWNVNVNISIDGWLGLRDGFTITPQTVTVIVHGYQPDGMVPGWTYDMRQAIFDRTAETYPGMVVIVFDWAEASRQHIPADGELKGRRASDVLKLEAQRLAGQLVNTHVVTADPSCHVHLIGHSRGGSLVSYAASLLNSHFGRRVVNHMTILDGIDEKSQIAGWYLQDPAICGNNADWTDNYYQTNDWLHGEERPDADHNEEWEEEHHGGFAEAYTDTIIDTESNYGYYWSLGGGGWDDPVKPHGRAFCSQSGTETVVNGDYQTQDLLGWSTPLGTPSVVLHGADNYVCQMQEQSSVAIAQTIMLPAHTRFLLFDFAFTDQGDGDSLTVTLGGTTIFTFVGTNFGSGDLVSSGLIDISALAGQISSELAFMLNSVGEPGATVLLDNIKVITTGDPDADGDVDMSDFSIFAAHWLHDGCNAPDWCDGTDIAPEIPDGLVDVLDLAKLAEHWLEGTE